MDTEAQEQIYERTHPDGSSLFVHLKLPREVTAIIGPFFQTKTESDPQPPHPIPNFDVPTTLTTIDLNWAIRGTAAGFPPVNTDIITVDQMALPLTLKGAAIIDSWEHDKPNGWCELAQANAKLLPIHMALAIRTMNQGTVN